jgi:asparagine synthase (glutamine-hydrolysing)
MKVRNGTRKWILRQVLHRHVPRKLVDGPKKGFAIPIGQWLRGPLLSWADRLLEPERIADEGFFDERLITAKWTEHKKGRFDWSNPLWTILMFQAWYESQRSSSSSSRRATG